MRHSFLIVAIALGIAPAAVRSQQTLATFGDDPSIGFYASAGGVHNPENRLALDSERLRGRELGQVSRLCPCVDEPIGTVLHVWGESELLYALDRIR